MAVIGNNPDFYGLNNVTGVNVYDNTYGGGIMRDGYVQPRPSMVVGCGNHSCRQCYGQQTVSTITTTGFYPFGTNQLTPKEKPMSIVTKLKNLELTTDEKLLRKYGLKDSDGDWTDEATEVLDNMLLEERKADLIDKVKKLDAEEKAAKETK